jgi:hypothetical protein
MSFNGRKPGSDPGNERSSRSAPTKLKIMPLVFTPVYQNTLTGANQNPLDPTNLSNAGLNNLQVLNHQGIGTVLGDYNVGLYIGSPSLSNDQYVSVNLVSLTNAGELDIYIRSNAGLSTYYDFGLLDNEDGTAECYLFGSGVIFDRTVTLVPNEVWVLGIVGTTIYVLRNGAIFFKGTNSDFASGTAGFSLYPSVAVTDAIVTNVTIGNLSGSQDAAYSVPDDRNYGTFPNNAIDVQGTETYTVPAHPSRTAPVDSRAAGAPVDSRVSGSIPINSRAPGTFGPGE